MRQILLPSAAVVAVVVAACGGNVVVDMSTPTSGAGGLGGSTSSSGMGAFPGVGGSIGVGVPAGVGGSIGVGAPAGVGGSTGCLVPPPGNTIMPCGASGAATSGGLPTCEFHYCLSNSPDTPTSQCQGSTCECMINLQKICTCTVPGVSDICSLGHDCCIHP